MLGTTEIIIIAVLGILIFGKTTMKIFTKKTIELVKEGKESVKELKDGLNDDKKTQPNNI